MQLPIIQYFPHYSKRVAVWGTAYHRPSPRCVSHVDVVAASDAQLRIDIGPAALARSPGPCSGGRRKGKGGKGSNVSTIGHIPAHLASSSDLLANCITDEAATRKGRRAIVRRPDEWQVMRPIHAVDMCYLDVVPLTRGPVPLPDSGVSTALVCVRVVVLEDAELGDMIVSSHLVIDKVHTTPCNIGVLLSYWLRCAGVTGVASVAGVAGVAGVPEAGAACAWTVLL